jgi:hypothetical protein
MIPALALWIGGGVLGTLGLLKVRQVVIADKAAKAAGAAAGTAAGTVTATPAQVAAVTPAQVAAAAAANGQTVAQLSAAAQAAGTTPQQLLADAGAAGQAVAQQLIDQQNGVAPAAAAQAQAIDPTLAAAQARLAATPDPTAAGSGALQAQTNPGQQARVTTNDPAPSGDLVIRAAPDASSQQIGGAEKDGIVFILEDAGNGFSQISWPGGSRLPAAQGFAHTQFLNTNFNGDGFVDASEAYGKDYA